MNKKSLIITEEDKKLILKMYGLISEQQVSDPLRYTPEPAQSDYLGQTGAFSQNYTPDVYRAEVETQNKKQKEIEKQEELEKNKPKTLLSLYNEWKKKEEDTEKLIEDGWKKFYDEDGEYTGNTSNRARVEWAKGISERREQSTKSEQIQNIINDSLSSLPKFIYVDLVTKKEFSDKPNDYTPYKYGGYYETTPPNTIYEPISETTISLTPNNNELTQNKEFNEKYKIYRSPADISKILSEKLSSLNLNVYAQKKYNVEQLKSNTFLLRLFKPEQIEAALRECAGDATYPFLMSIIEGRLVDKSGRIVGRKDKNGEIVPYVPPTGLNDEYGGIPCESEWEWRYAVPAQLIAGLLVGIMAPYGGWMMWASLLVDATINASVLIGSMDSQDESLVKMNAAYLILPFLVETGPFRELMNLAQFGKEYKIIAQEMIRELESLKGAGGKVDMNKLIPYLDNLSEEKKRLLYHLNDPRFKKYIKNALGDAYRQLQKFKKLGPEITMSWSLRNLPTISTLAIYGSPAGAYFLTQYIDALEQKLKVKFSEEERKFWSTFFSLYTSDQRQQIIALNVENLARLSKDLEDAKKKAKELEEKAKSIEESKIKELVDAGKEFGDIFYQLLEDACEENNIPPPNKQVQPDVKNALDKEAKSEESAGAGRGN